MPAETIAAAAIRIRLNGADSTTTAATLEDVLAEHGFAGQKVATALNGTFVPARSRTGQAIRDGDHVEVVSARQGG